MKIIYGQNGVVVNFVQGPDPISTDPIAWPVADSVVTQIGAPFDPKDPQIDAVDAAVFRVLHRHENLIRELIRTVRTNASLNTQANNNGLPTSANSADLTLAQARDAFKTLLP